MEVKFFIDNRMPADRLQGFIITQHELACILTHAKPNENQFQCYRLKDHMLADILSR